MYLHVAEVGLRVVLGEDVAFHVSERAGEFYSGSASAYDGKGEDFLLFFGVWLGDGFFQTEEYSVTQEQGFGDGFEGVGVVSQGVVAEVVCVTSCGDDEIVVGDVSQGGAECFCVREGAFGGTHSEVEVFFTVKGFPQGVGDGAGFESSCGDLVEQGLELVVGVFIQKDDLIESGVELFGYFQSCKSSAYDDDSFFVSFIRDVGNGIHDCCFINDRL